MAEAFISLLLKEVVTRVLPTYLLKKKNSTQLQNMKVLQPINRGLIGIYVPSCVCNMIVACFQDKPVYNQLEIQCVFLTRPEF